MLGEGITLAKVVNVHPGAHAVDLLFLEDGSRVPMVQVISHSASTNSGHAGLAQPDTPASGDPWDFNDSKTRDVYAIVAFMRKYPVVLGFLFPQVAQMLFADINRSINRHPSDVYTSIDDAGNMEVYHPSGTYLRIGSSSAHEDLTGKDVDGKWKMARNTGAAVHVHLSVANAGAQVASIDIDPSGNITEQNNGSLTANVGGAANVTAGGAATLKAPSVTIDAASTTITGSLTVEGAATMQSSASISGAATMSGGMSVSGGAGGSAATVQGGMSLTGDVSANGISLTQHVHNDPQGGTTGKPQ